MHSTTIANQLENVTVWRKGAQRAPHKPLLLLLALAAVQRKEPRLQPYELIDGQLRKLLIEFGPPRRSYHPEYPFWRLQNDGDFWEIPQRRELEEARSGRAQSGDMPRSLLQEYHAAGGFTEPVYQLLASNPQLVNEITAKILQDNFPASLHEDILDAVGMPWVQVIGSRTERDPAFRDTIIRIYEHRCAVCGFDGRLGASDLALEAAHVKWYAAGGPDSEDNGLALCVLHHRLFDRGALGLDENHRILVSQHVVGGEQVLHAVTRFAGHPLRQPQPGTRRVAREYIQWHRHEVFRGPARLAEAHNASES
ncbi:MAG: HNH endonuclease [Caldilineaceae bacterium]|nr:HNH endonuclease [Caldilineaceae bacterium]